MSFVLAFDCEYTGTNPYVHHLAEIGVTFRDCNKHVVLKRFTAMINMPKELKWDDEVVENFWKKKITMARYLNVKQTIEEGKALDVKEMLKNLVSFITECWEISGRSMVIASDRIDQDNLWLSMYLCKHGYQPLTKITGKDVRLLDLNSFFQGCSLTTHTEIRKFEALGKGYDCLEAAFVGFGIAIRPKTQKTHSAIDDSEYYAEAYDIITEHIKIIKLQEQAMYTPNFVTTLYTYPIY